ncbi:hypothetical protein EV383_0663 [Pseudonocardia sediminis]|uniref:Uncharacterized protein n=1 Tax=Pseudonocardia sediminis TaxID=1397368 RepID=A0A4Q7USA4_PSEST|nr:hypothetical protein [Pseudonocardia sediminis]RZT83844.1 hypothetical protein EV383_0663 [Pseudonocardia sediminis]
MADDRSPASAEESDVDWFDPAGQQLEHAHPARDEALPPGSNRAREQGCVCSVLGNAAYRVGAAEHPLIDPECERH